MDGLGLHSGGTSPLHLPELTPPRPAMLLCPAKINTSLGRSLAAVLQWAISRTESKDNLDMLIIFIKLIKRTTLSRIHVFSARISPRSFRLGAKKDAETAASEDADVSA